MTRPPMTRPRGEDGQLLVLTAFLGVVLILLVAVVVDASAAFLARRGLASQADGAALAAAQAVDVEAFYTGAATATLPLGDVEETARDYVAEHFPGTEVVDVTTDGITVTVTLRRHLALPLSPPGYEHIEVTAGATARLPVR